jgi:hypothetical protein
VRPSEIGNAPVATRQMRQNLPARWIGQRGKSSIQCSRGIFNHLVNYLAESFQRATFFLTICRSRPAAVILRDERFFVHDVRHLCRIAAVVAFENVDESLYAAAGHAFVWVDIQTCNLRAAGEMMEQAATISDF